MNRPRFVLLKDHPQILEPKLEEIPDTLMALFYETKRCFIKGMETLCEFGLHPAVSNLAKYTKDLLDLDYIQFTMGDVPSLTMAVLGKDNIVVGLIIAPHNWIEMCDADPSCQLGAIIYCASQAADFYNQRLGDDLPKRGAAYEAEYIKGIRNMPGMELNQYQQKIVQIFPDGIPPELIAQLKPIKTKEQMN